MTEPTTHHQQVIITEKETGLRLDQALTQLIPDYSRSQWQQWIKNGDIQVNQNTVTQPKTKVKFSQIIDIHITFKPQVSWQAQKLDIDIIHEDDALIVINKPAGLVTHPGAGNPDQTLVNALLHHHNALETLPRAGIVHRLDKDTTGLMVVAKTLSSHQQLVKAIQDRQLKRVYQAVAVGTFVAGGTLDFPMGRHPVHRTKMAVTPGGKTAITHYRLIERFKGHTHLKVILDTGRTHQIRVHFAHIKHPLVGDPVYGNKRTVISPGNPSLKQCLQTFRRQALHAAELTLTEHPITGKTMYWQAPIPHDFQKLLLALKDNEASPHDNHHR